MTRLVSGLAVAALAIGAAACGSSSEESDPTTPAPNGRLPDQAPPPNTVGGFSVKMPTVTLAPGEERLPCWVFPLEVEGPSRFVGAASVTTSDGMHHGNITTRPKTGEGMRECEPGGGDEATDVLDGGAVLFGSSTQLVGTEWHRFNEGQAYRVKDGYEIVARMHYLNTSTKELTVAPEYHWYTIPEQDVVDELGPFAWVLSEFEIPPNSQYTTSTECGFYKPMKVVDAMPHMHALGTRFFAGYLGGERDGELWLDDQGFDEASDIYLFDPAVDLGQGLGMTFGCTWNNPHGKVIEEGIGDNEMCILFGYGSPAENCFSVLAVDNGKCLSVLPPPPDGP